MLPIRRVLFLGVRGSGFRDGEELRAASCCWGVGVVGREFMNFYGIQTSSDG
jgi:hypothetical protein